MERNINVRAIILLVALLVSGILHSQVVLREPLSERITGYTLDVQLDDVSGIITGSVNAFWVNKSPFPVGEAHLHMYMNAFRSTRSTYNGISGTMPPLPEEDYGWIDITSLTDAAGNNLTQSMEYISPDDGNEYDKTVLRIPLTSPVQPGDTLRLSGRFETKLPASIRRTGRNKDFFFVAQWFPKFGVYEQNRQTGVWGWNCHQFHRTSEFYSNHSVYDVTITLPEEYIVGTGGIILKEEVLPEGLKRQIWRAEDIVDFAWTAWPGYRVYTDRWNHVAITLLISPGRKGQVERHLGAVKNTLEYLSERVGPYPWPHVTVVDPPAIGQGAGGMEYTTLFTGSGMDFAPAWVRIPELVTSHELGHAWFMGMLASNEFEEPWLDEGVNSFWEQRIIDHYYGGDDGRGLFNHPLLKISDRSFGRFQYIVSGSRQVTDNTPPSWGYPHDSYGMMSYQKAALWLQTLTGIVGEETIDDIFREYYRRWSFRHPRGQDFIDVVNDVVTGKHGDRFGTDMNWFFENTLYSTGICDYKVYYFGTRKVWPYQGIERSGDSLYLSSPDTSDLPAVYRAVVQLQRLGEVVMPVEVRIGMADGEVLTMFWDGKERYKDFIFETEEDRGIGWVHIDPDFRNPMDVNIRNNSVTMKSDQKPMLRFARKLLFAVQMIMNFIMI